MINKDSIFDFFTFLLERIGFADTSIAYGNQDGKRPVGDYIILNFTTPKKSIGSPSTKQEIDGLVYSDDFEATLSVNIYGANSAQIVDEIHTLLDYDSVQLKAKEFGLAYFDKTQINDLTYILGVHWLDRYQFDLFLRSKKVSKDTGETYIESTNI